MEPHSNSGDGLDPNSNNKEESCESSQAQNDQVQESPQANTASNEMFVPLDEAGLALIKAISDLAQQGLNRNLLGCDQSPISNDNQHQAFVFSDDDFHADMRQDDGGASTRENASFEPDADSDWPEDTENEGQSKFHEAQIHFDSLPAPSLEDVVELRKAEREEYSLQKKLESQRNARFFQNGNGEPPKMTSGLSESSVGKPEEGPSPEEAQQPPKQHPPSSSARSHKTTRATLTRSRSILVARNDKTKAMEIGLSSMIGSNRLTKELYLRDNPDPETPQDSVTKPRYKRSGDRQNFTEDELKTLLGPEDIIAAAQSSASMPAMHVSKEKRKTRALTEMVASIPAENKKDATNDRKTVENAMKAFFRKPRLGDDGRWKVLGLKTTLMYHQIIAVGWMRRRETSITDPQGGLLCDTMGFGKTLTAIANIMDGRHVENLENSPTLIVVPSNLRTHWAQQIEQHCDPAEFGKAFEYHRRLRFGDINIMNTVKEHDVVLTTYEEVRRSYPVAKIPDRLTSKEEIIDWWLDYYDREVGLLHKIKWHRIVLDEGHIIKNYLSQVSIAIQALTGKFKWLMSGTPLHNCIEELYPYFHFLGVPRSFSSGSFEKQFCSVDDPNSRQRLINVLRSILHRKTHESRLFGAPVVRLPTISQDNYLVNFCKAEWFLYERISDVFVQNINKLSGPNETFRQRRCILAMFLKLRMFASHVLTAQDLVQYVLEDDDTLEELKVLADEAYSDATSAQICKLILSAKAGEADPTTPPGSESPTPVRPSGNLNKLILDFRMMLAGARDEEQDERYKCPFCTSDPVSAIITSCRHLYCEECYNALPGKDGNTNSTDSRVCCSCEKPIEDAAVWSDFDKITPFTGHTSLAASRKRRLNLRAGKTSGPRFKRAFGASKRAKAYENRSYPTHSAGQAEGDANCEPEELIEDWIPLIGRDMPAAKLTKIREILKKWIQADVKVKIVVFVFFLSSVELLQMMCKQEGWPHTKLEGKMSESSRNHSISEFQQNEDVKILIATYKTGGFGVDLSKANKCILVDLWWNESVEYQAYGRLLRLNQERKMECVKLLAAKSLDERMLEIQQNKTRNIDQVMSQKVLNERATIKELLTYFGNVTDVKGGGFKITRPPREKHTRRPKPNSQ